MLDDASSNNLTSRQVNGRFSTRGGPAQALGQCTENAVTALGHLLFYQTLPGMVRTESGGLRAFGLGHLLAICVVTAWCGKKVANMVISEPSKVAAIGRMSSFAE